MTATLRAAAAGDGGGPVRAALTTAEGVWLAAMPAWSGTPRPSLGAKLVVAIPGNAARGLPTHRAVVVLLDPATGAPTAWVEAEALTRARTAAVSVVATRRLARKAKGRHAILGAGAQGSAHLDAFARAGLLQQLAVWSRDRDRAQRLVVAARALGIAARLAQTAGDAVRGADVITTCTGSAEPLFDAASIADGAHVNAIGACVADKRELPGRLIGQSTLVVDDAAAARAEAGDVLLAVAEGTAAWEGVVSLGEVLLGRATPRTGRVSVFVSLGLGVEDVATAAALVGS
ncbi:MAG: Ornithine cyclodeaminase [Candidatus Eremiobacteraeota bacterium]|jgi:ornithine cyclodeaminase|nr:Ornithine cyclodeaminase [Candidatus Eremiobacteraeota bacterium]